MSREHLPKPGALNGHHLADADLLLECEVGRGNNGVVYKASRAITSGGDRDEMAAKLIPSGNLRPGYEAEFAKLTRLSSLPEIVRFRERHQLEFEGEHYVCVCYELVEGKDLRTYAKDHPSSITLPFIENLVRTVLRVMFAMRQRGIVHGDIHAGNVMVANDPLIYGRSEVIKITDFGIGGSQNNLTPKDDYRQLAALCRELLLLVDPAELGSRDKRRREFLVREFIPKYVLEENPTVGLFVREPSELIEALDAFSEGLNRDDWTDTPSTLENPFEYLSCEQISDSFALLQRLYTENFPGYADLLKRTNTILTGPRGCGKTTILRNLALKAKMLGSGQRLRDGDGFTGIYYHCGDLYFAFSHARKSLSKTDSRLLVHYFNLNLFREIVDTFAVAEEADRSDGTWSRDQAGALQQFVSDWVPAYRPPPVGTPALSHLRSYLDRERHEVERTLRRPNRRPPADPLPIDFIPKLCDRLQKIVPWLQDRPFYFLLDDYSTPHVSPSIQEVLNDLVMYRWAPCFFKVSTESIVSFHPQSASGKLMEAGREYDPVDLGSHFMSRHSAGNGRADAREERRRFVVEVINNRLETTRGVQPEYQDIQTILGESPYGSYNEMARALRKSNRVYYAGVDTLTDLFSGDIADMLRLAQAILREAGGTDALTRTGGLQTPIDPADQDKAISQYGGGFLEKIEAAPATGPHLRRVVEGFGKVAHLYLKERTSGNEGAAPPWQAFRIEMQKPPPLDQDDVIQDLYPLLVREEEQRDLGLDQFKDHLNTVYRDLLRYGVFLRDARGKSQRGAVVPRLYLRRLLLPTFNLTPSQRDSVSMEAEDFLLLLHDPDAFVARMTARVRKGADPAQANLFADSAEGLS